TGRRERSIVRPPFLPPRRTMRLTAALLSLSLLIPLRSQARAADATAPAPALQPPTLRLPTQVRPRHYEVELHVGPTPDSFDATATFALDVREPASVVWLNGAGLTVSKATFRVGDQASPARVVPGGEQFIGFVPERRLEKGPATLVIEYRGEISRTS